MNATSTPGQADKYPLLIEIGVEEIPSNVIAPSLEQLSTLSAAHLSKATLSFSNPETYGTPRRMTLYISELDAMQETTTEVIVGPPERAAYDASGAPTAAAVGFAKSQGVPLSEVKVADAESLGAAAKGKKGAYLVYHRRKAGEATAALLMTMIPEILAQLHFPRSMRWNNSGVSFVRPIRSILAIYKGRVVPFSFAGVASAQASHGHHIMSPAAFQVLDFETYQAELSRRYVMMDPGERVRVIRSQMEDLAEEKQAVLDLSDTALLWDAAHTVEYPKAICGDFDAAFLKIPKEIITTAMAEHQGYFPLYREDGELLPHFITILNIDSEDLSLIQKGNERVLRARLHDARFYFDQDRKQRFPDRLEDLKQVMFQEKLGSIYEKVKRLQGLSVFIADVIGRSNEDQEDLKRAAGLCKNDLVTGVVREFTSLQGTMGRVYAELEGENTYVARAIEEHYLPRHAGDQLPVVRSVGEILAIADKLDTIVGCFGVGLIPTGSEDPYALRRQGLGIIQILVDNPKSYIVWQQLSLKDTIKQAIELYKDRFYDPELSEKILSFFKLRIDSYLQHSRKIRYDLREAILTRDLDKPLVLVECVEALEKFSKQAVFKSLITVYKRVARILPEHFEGKVNPALLIHPSEKALYEQYQSVSERIQHHWVTQQYRDVLTRLSELHDPLNQFFDDVMVMDKDEAVRQNRLSLLFVVSEGFKTFGDFSKIVEE